MKRNISKEIKRIARERIGQPRPKKIIKSKKRTAIAQAWEDDLTEGKIICICGSDICGGYCVRD